MAETTIRINYPNLALVTRFGTENNSCYSIFKYEINVIPGTQIQVDLSRVNTNVEDYDAGAIQVDGIWKELSSTNTFTLQSGKAIVKVALGNVSLNIIKNGDGTCNRAKLQITNLSTSETNIQNMYRCNTATRCADYSFDIQTNPENNTEITPDTNIIIEFDASGSMDDTLPALNTMRDTLLKDILLPYYNNNISTYNAKVRVRSFGEDPLSEWHENTFGVLNFRGETYTGKVITLVFQDEADHYTGFLSAFNPYSARLEPYDENLAVLRQRLLSFDENYYHGVVFQVKNYEIQEGINFKDMLIAAKNGIGNYAGTNGLSDKDNITFKYDIEDGASPEYYLNLVIGALNEFGFNL